MSWQYSTTTAKDKLLHLMSSKEMSDITVEVGREKQSFSTHTFLMSMYSEVFHSMFHGPLQEKTKHICLPEDSAEAFQVFFEYMYTDSVKLNSVEEAISSLYFGEKYMVKCMKEESVSYLENNITLESVLNIYEVATLHQETELQTECWEYIVENISEIINQDAIKYVRFETILNIISADFIGPYYVLTSELDKYKAIIKWSKQKYQDHTPQNLRKQLKPLLDQVKFRTMKPSEFIEDPCEDGILTKDEQLEILKEICKSTSETYKDNCRKSSKPFSKVYKDSLHENSGLNLASKCTKSTFPVILDHFLVNESLYVSAVSFDIGYQELVPACNRNHWIKLKITNLKNGRYTELNTHIMHNFNPEDIFLRTRDAIYVQRNEILQIELRFLSLFEFDFTNFRNRSNDKRLTKLSNVVTGITIELNSIHCRIENGLNVILGKEYIT